MNRPHRLDPLAERVLSLLSAKAEARRIREAMQQVAAETQMTLRERRFGDTFSFELVRRNSCGSRFRSQCDQSPSRSRN